MLVEALELLLERGDFQLVRESSRPNAARWLRAQHVVANDASQAVPDDRHLMQDGRGRRETDPSAGGREGGGEGKVGGDPRR